MFCGQCGAKVEAALPFCEECGAPLTMEGDLGDADAEVFPLLAAANLARMRGDFDEASGRCIEVLRRYPNNASAHSLMGDIYREQNEYRDAIEWYKLALELNPRSQSDRAKLEELLDLVYEEPEAAPVTTPLDALQERLGIGRPVLFGGLAALAVLVVAVAAVYLWRVSLSARTTELAAPTPHLDRTAPQPPPREFVAPAQPPPEGAVGDWAEATTPPPPAPLDLPADQRLREHLTALLPRDTSVAEVYIDPRDRSVELTLAVPAGTTAAGTRDRIRAVLVPTIEAALRTIEQPGGVRLKVYATDEAGGREMAFVCDWRGVDLAGLPPAGTSADGLLELGRTPWWHPSLAPPDGGGS